MSLELNRLQKYQVISKLSNCFCLLKQKQIEKTLSFFVHYLLKLTKLLIYSILFYYIYCFYPKISHKFGSN